MWRVGGQPVLFALGVLFAIVGSVGAYIVLGGLGVTLLGLGTLFIAVRMDLERQAPVGGDFNEGLFAATLSAQQQRRPEDRLHGLTSALAFTRLNTWAQIIGASILLIGIALWQWGM